MKKNLTIRSKEREGEEKWNPNSPNRSVLCFSLTHPQNPQNPQNPLHSSPLHHHQWRLQLPVPLSISFPPHPLPLLQPVLPFFNFPHPPLPLPQFASAAPPLTALALPPQTRFSPSMSLPRFGRLEARLRGVWCPWPRRALGICLLLT